MTKNLDSAGHRLLSVWQKLHNKPLGKWLFKKIIARKVPYTGSIKADVRELKPGHCEVILKYRRSNTNHLNCVHALALSNLGELAGGLAMMTGLPPHIRGIVTHINTEYLKKARGQLRAVANADIPAVTEPKTVHHVRADIFDQDQDLVTQVTVQWLLSPKA
ncbi:DUF4442 domain-containing protein [Marinicella sediminis]|uniref:DUF4442 domain-containing protein n=1 Tax=Marinicella sediminis TaxID=1792834 RepID=A0ABV7JCS9_9GAMM|nr:DUF4442 domain-containing protein [Marinicella sediminis]